MSSRISTLVVALVLALSGSASARAVWAPLPSPALNLRHALKVATAYWGGVCEPLRIDTADLPYPQAAVAYETASGPLCHITLDVDWPHWSRATLCAVMVHEVGHVTGHDHSTDPASPMYPGARDPQICHGPWRW